MSKTGISYADDAENPTAGCTPPPGSALKGCLNCWSCGLHEQRRQALLAGKAMPPQYAKPFYEIQLFPERLLKLLPKVRRQRKSKIRFWGSSADLFHPRVPFEFVAACFDVMRNCGDDIHLLLTKRPERMLAFYRWVEEQVPALRVQLGPQEDYVGYSGTRWPFSWPGAVCHYHAEKLLLPCFEHAGMDMHGRLHHFSLRKWPDRSIVPGCTVEDEETAAVRIPILQQVPAAHGRWLSYEPALGPISWAGRLDGIRWLVMGCESVPRDRNRERPMDEAWALSTLQACQAYGTALYYKQAIRDGRLIHAPELAGAQRLERVADRPWNGRPVDASAVVQPSEVCR